MARKLGKALLTAAFAYAIMVAILWAMQDRFIYPAPDYVVAPGPGFEEIALTTEDGLTLRAFTRPARGDLPYVIYFHGNGGTLGASMNATRMLAAAGYGLLLPEYRGYGGNPGSPSEAGFYRDGRAAMQWLAAQRIAPQDTVIVGNSIGSGTAVQMAVEFQPKALMLTAPFTSLPDAAQDALPFVPAQLLMRDRFENDKKITNLDMPLLIMHGTDDRVVPFAHGEALARLAPAATFKRFEDSGHALSFRKFAQQAQREWLDQLLNVGEGM